MTHSPPALAFRTVYAVLSRLRPRTAAAYATTAPAPAPPTTPDHGAGTIPRRIWSYWHSVQPDAFVERCVANWRAQCPGFEVQVLNQQTVRDHVPPVDWPEDFERLDPVKQSDWIRLYLVGRYGGYWLDATVLLTRPIDWLETARAAQGADFAGFYLQGYTRDARFPVVENWAFGAPADSAFVTAWQREFHHALFELGTAAYLAARRAEPGWEALLQGIPDPVYLLGHVTAQRVLRQGGGTHRLALARAEDTAFFYQKAVGWKWYLLYPRLCLVPANAQVPPLVKLRGGERRHFAQLFERHGEPRPGTLWGRACRPRA